MANNDQQPWQPDPAKGAGEEGERGSSVFDGNADYDLYGRAIGTDPNRGPRLGVDYAVADGTDTITDVSERGVVGATVERAGTHAPAATSVVLTADDDTPVHDVAVLFTATVTFPGDWPEGGSVAFKEGATVLGTDSSIVSGVATYNHVAGFAAGAHTITAVYSGTAEYATSTSTGLVVTASA